MGGSESKRADSNGQVANNVFIENMDIKSSSLLIIMSLILLVKVIHLSYIIYTGHRRSLRKQYESRAQVNV
jgi:hypothetical protein